MVEQKDKHPWAPKTMFLLYMAVAAIFIIVGVIL